MNKLRDRKERFLYEFLRKADIISGGWWDKNLYWKISHDDFYSIINSTQTETIPKTNSDEEICNPNWELRSNLWHIVGNLQGAAEVLLISDDQSNQKMGEFLKSCAEALEQIGAKL